MSEKSLLDDKTILVVDDEPDILESIRELLTMCRVVTASSFQEACKMLEVETIDMAILDIMGVDGYRLLDLAKEREVPAVMLTAHALSPDDLIKSHKKGALSYIPKEAMHELPSLLEEILEARETGNSTWGRIFNRLEHYFDAKFGVEWKEGDKAYWEKFKLDI
jgi:DNA-binding NtrC family response regulator